MKKAEQLRKSVLAFRAEEAKKQAELLEKQHIAKYEKVAKFKAECMNDAAVRYSALVRHLDDLARSGRTCIRLDIGGCSSYNRDMCDEDCNLRLDIIKDEITRLAILDGFKVIDCSNVYGQQRIVTIDLSWAP